MIDTNGRKGFIENDWVGKVIATGPEARIQVAGPGPRCVMTTLAQAGTVRVGHALTIL